MTPDLAGTWWQQPLACRLGCVYFLESYEYYRTWASEGFFLEGVIVDFFRGWPKRFLPGGKQCWSFIVSTPKIGEKHFSTKNLTAKYYQNPRRPRCQGRIEWGKGGAIPRALSHYGGHWMAAGGAENPNNVTSTFFNTVYLLPGDLRFEHGGAKLASCPGRHLTSLRPCSALLPFPADAHATAGCSKNITRETYCNNGKHQQRINSRQRTLTKLAENNIWMLTIWVRRAQFSEERRSTGAVFIFFDTLLIVCVQDSI